MPLLLVAIAASAPLLSAQGSREAGGETTTFRVARAAFETKLLRRDRQNRELEAPPEALFELVKYPAPCGPTAAYLSRTTDETKASGQRLPAVVWITGGFPAARGGATVWTPGPPDNDQSATAFREAGAVMLFPTVRGTAMNPGVQEHNLGEVDDVIAAAEYLKGLAHVDPARIYLGGHSTGGTFVLLVAEATDLFRATFSFGPVGRFQGYGDRDWPFDLASEEECWMRSPIHHLDEIRTPVYVIEGTGGNRSDLEEIREANANPLVSCIALDFADHFTPLYPTNALLAKAVMAHVDGAFRVEPEAIQAAYDEYLVEQRQERDRRAIADAVSAGAQLGEPRTILFHVRGWDDAAVKVARQRLEAQGFRIVERPPYIGESGDPCARFDAAIELAFGPQPIFDASAKVRAAVMEGRIIDEGWSSPDYHAPRQ